MSECPVISCFRVWGSKQAAHLINVFVVRLDGNPIMRLFKKQTSLSGFSMISVATSKRWRTFFKTKLTTSNIQRVNECQATAISCFKMQGYSSQAPHKHLGNVLVTIGRRPLAWQNTSQATLNFTASGAGHQISILYGWFHSAHYKPSLCPQAHSIRLETLGRS